MIFDIAERDRILRELDVPAFHAYLLSHGKILPFKNREGRPRNEIALAALHKARIVWFGSTPAMCADSRAWLIAHDYRGLGGMPV